jgi:TonB-dependent SusC/RagA subfamily outer membrane receptor
MRISRRPRPAALRSGLALLALAAACGPAAPEPESEPKPEDEVVTGYGSEPRATSTASVSTLTREEIHDRHASSVQELLERLPGVTVSRRGGEMAVRIRGIRSMSGSSEPLFVVDGVARTAMAMDAILPSSIVRIDVLKDAGTLAMYGSRGANGVILVTTLDAP